MGNRRLAQCKARIVGKLDFQNFRGAFPGSSCDRRRPAGSARRLIDDGRLLITARERAASSATWKREISLLGDGTSSPSGAKLPQIMQLKVRIPDTSGSWKASCSLPISPTDIDCCDWRISLSRSSRDRRTLRFFLFLWRSSTACSIWGTTGELQ